jgi:hypothetical protein
MTNSKDYAGARSATPVVGTGRDPSSRMPHVKESPFASSSDLLCRNSRKFDRSTTTRNTE